MNKQIEFAESSAKRIFGTNKFTKFNKTSRGIIIDLIFQLGESKFKGFSETIKAFKSGDIATAAFEIINSIAFKTQTPTRFAKHYTRLINSSNLSPQQRKAAKDKALKFANKVKPRNSSKSQLAPVKEVFNAIF
jgi:hypothetical protein